MLQEAHRLIQAKEQSLASLRDTLNSGKRSYDSKLQQLEQILVNRDAEIADLQAQLFHVKADRDHYGSQVAAMQSTSQNLSDQQHDLLDSLRQKTDEQSQVISWAWRTPFWGMSLAASLCCMSTYSSAFVLWRAWSWRAYLFPRTRAQSTSKDASLVISMLGPDPPTTCTTDCHPCCRIKHF